MEARLYDSESASVSLDPIAAYLDCDDASVETLPRPPPIVHEVAAATRFAESMPEEAGKEIVRLREEVDRLRILLGEISHTADDLSEKLTEKVEKLENALAIEDEIKNSGGLSRENVTSVEWHEKHKKMAQHLWGLGTFSETIYAMLQKYGSQMLSKITAS